MIEFLVQSGLNDTQKCDILINFTFYKGRLFNGAETGPFFVHLAIKPISLIIISIDICIANM